MIRWIPLAICLIKLVECTMEGFIVGGDRASIYLYPHSAFMKVKCFRSNGEDTKWICGASIINQQILLTAAHCLACCSLSLTIQITVGNENREHGTHNSAASILVHEDYDPRTSFADIGLLKMFYRLSLGLKISRVALMRKPPYDGVAAIAGWGLIDEETLLSSPYLKHINQTVKNRKDCIRRILEVPQGCICASSNKMTDYAAAGDSGSALIIRGYIQIGIVSHKLPAMSRNIIVYTEIAHYYNWIKENINRLFCSK